MFYFDIEGGNFRDPMVVTYCVQGEVVMFYSDMEGR